MAHKRDEQRWQAQCRQMLQSFTASSARTSHPHWPAVTRPSGPTALAASGHLPKGKQALSTGHPERHRNLLIL